MDIASILANSGYSLHALGQRPEGASKPSDEEMALRLIEQRDKNDNGTLDAAELCISEEAFKQVDADGDGQLNAQELIDGAEQIRKAMGPPPGMPSMQGRASDETDNTTKTLLDYIKQDEEEDDTTKTVLDLLF